MNGATPNHSAAATTSSAAPVDSRTVPAGTIWQLRNFEPALESLACFLHRTSPERFSTALSGAGVCALRTVPAEHDGIGLPVGSMILVDSLRWSEPGAVSLLGLRDGRILFREFHPEGDLIRFRSVVDGGGGDFVWRRSSEPGRILWMYPVLEFVLPMF